MGVISTSSDQDDKSISKKTSSKRRQSRYRQRLSDSGLKYVYIRLTAKAHGNLTAIKQHLGLPNLDSAANACIEHKFSSLPLLKPRTDDDPIGSRQLPLFLKQENISLIREPVEYRNQWWALSAIIEAYFEHLESE